MTQNLSKGGKVVKGVVPCGNPQRYGSRDVVRMHRSSASGIKRGHGPDGEDGQETEGEKHLKTMLRQQMQTDITVADQFSSHREFTPATSHAPGVQKLVGVHKFDDYRNVDALDSKIDELRHCGLNDEEIALKLAEDMKDELEIPQTGYGADPEIRQAKLREIAKKIEEKKNSLSQPDTFKGALELSRQEMDVDKSLAQKRGRDGGVVDAINVITTHKKFEPTHPDDPVNHIPEMMNKLEGKVERAPRRERRRRRKVERRRQFYENLAAKSTESEDDEDKANLNNSHNVYNVEETSQSPEKGQMSTTLSAYERLTDATDISQPRVDSHHIKEQPIQGRENVNQPISVREISSTLPILTKEDILANRLSLEEIKSMEKFRNYETGPPNKVVYVKNLSPQTKEEDLLSLFGLFQSADKSKIVFKLLNGRMKGQAFITFPDEEIAGRAIDLVNGYQLKGKPVILSYGKKQS